MAHLMPAVEHHCLSVLCLRMARWQRLAVDAEAVWAFAGCGSDLLLCFLVFSIAFSFVCLVLLAVALSSKMALQADARFALCVAKGARGPPIVIALLRAAQRRLVHVMCSSLLQFLSSFWRRLYVLLLHW